MIILGDDPFGDAFNRLKKRPVKGRYLQVKRINDIKDLETCDLLYICDSENYQLQEIISSLKDHKILTVGETEAFTQAGGIIAFYKEEDLVRFIINMPVADQVGIKFSAQLLEIGRVIR